MRRMRSEFAYPMNSATNHDSNSERTLSRHEFSSVNFDEEESDDDILQSSKAEGTEIGSSNISLNSPCLKMGIAKEGQLQPIEEENTPQQGTAGGQTVSEVPDPRQRRSKSFSHKEFRAAKSGHHYPGADPQAKRSIRNDAFLKNPKSEVQSTATNLNPSLSVLPSFSLYPFFSVFTHFRTREKRI